MDRSQMAGMNLSMASNVYTRHTTRKIKEKNCCQVRVIACCNRTKTKKYRRMMRYSKAKLKKELDIKRFVES